MLLPVTQIEGTFHSDVFISYAHTDAQIAQRFVSFLTSNGIVVTWDRDFDYGVLIPTAIQQGLRRSRWLIVLLSRSSAQRPWVQAESWSGERIIPLLVEAMTQDDVPLQLRPLKQASLVDWDGQTATSELKQLVEQIKRSRASESAAPTTDEGRREERRDRATQSTQPRVLLMAPMVALGTIILSVSVVAGWQLMAWFKHRHSAGGANPATVAMLAPRLDDGPCEFKGTVESVDVKGGSDGLLTAHQAFSAPYGQEVYMPDAWIERYNASNLKIRRGPGVRIKAAPMLTPVNADDGAFDVGYEVLKKSENPEQMKVRINVRNGGANGEITAGPIWANGVQMQGLNRGDGGQEPWEVSAQRPFVVELTLAAPTEWPNRVSPVIAGPFAKATEVRMQHAAGRLTCMDSFREAPSLIWRHGNLILEEITAEEGKLSVRLRSATPPDR